MIQILSKTYTSPRINVHGQEREGKMRYLLCKSLKVGRGAWTGQGEMEPGQTQEPFYTSDLLPVKRDHGHLFPHHLLSFI